MSSPLIIRNALYLGQAVDIAVRGGVVESVTPHEAARRSFPADTAVHEAQGLKIFPSFADCHVHLREPGYEYKEDIESGLRAAAHGGFGAVMAMANTNPVNDNASVTQSMLAKARATWPHGPRLFPVGAATVGLEGKQLAPMAELAAAGCAAISNDGRPVGGAELFRRCMEYARTCGLIVIDHCEDPTLAKDTHMNEGETSGRIGVKGQSVVAESVQAARDILLAEYLQIPVHLAHISCKQSVDLIRWAKERGVPVTAETCPHYLLLNDTELVNYSPMAKVNPPLRTPADVAAMRQALADGTIDILVTDHAPHAEHEKECTLDEAPNGISGLDSAVPLTWTLVRDGVLSEHDFIRRWCHAPAEIFNLPVNRFAPGDPADFFLFDPEERWVLTPDAMHSKGKNTPFLGRMLTGRVKAHWLGGVRVV
ncbi:dihydroorotase [Desulfovibrio psychrotolerans]|uniref:Dihydroorotase n=1 Tax=Desulfovibrio psychrotolerans TaxID=415242 RepID=A0A7J0BSE7_9BACT|nr:dihydroorotase [Desulfovibrio psychrotolerans]GFM36075.1 dihydroorotase [Desulfovibrio psychrotolerans]